MLPSAHDWRLGWAFARSLSSYYLRGKPRPLSASFAVTNRCNLRCQYCNTPFLDPRHLDLADIDRLFSRLRALGVERLGLAGGEPLVRNDLGEVVRLAAERGFWISINSNLNLYHRHPAVFDRVSLVFTSLDGTEEHHRAGRGDRSLEGTIEAIRDLRRRRIPVVAICVVDTHNLDDASYLLGLAEELDVRIHFQARCTDTEIVRGDYPDDLDNQRLRSFWRELAGRDSRRIASTPLYLDHMAGWSDFRRIAVRDDARRCAAGRGFLYVDPQGLAYPCAYTKGQVAPIDLLREEWSCSGSAPCTDCAVGPMAEFNLLFRRPFRAATDAFRRYGSGADRDSP